MAREEFRFAHRLRVRWAEADMQGVVFNAHYLTYIDSAIAEYWREIRLPYPDGYVDRYGSDLFLRKATVDYLGSARYDDRLSVLCRVAKLGRTSLTMQFEIWRSDDAEATSPLWLQLYIQRDRDFTQEFVERAEAAGCKGFCLTVDTPVLGPRNRDARSRLELPPGVGLANLEPLVAAMARRGSSPRRRSRRSSSS